jgi:hypothetical protein
MKNKPLAENYVHHFEGKVQAVDVAVNINYSRGTISLIDTGRMNDDGMLLDGKQWLFKNREIEYMAGWLDVLDAMKAAVVDARDKLAAFQEQEYKETEEHVANVLKVANSSS